MRAATARLGDYVATNMPDGDFGRILSLISGEYESMVTQVHSALGLDGTRLDDTGAALAASATHYAHTDAHVAQDFGVGAAITDDGHAGGASTTLAPPPQRRPVQR